MKEPERHDIRSEEDVVHLRQVVRAWARTLQLGIVDQTKLVTAASELVRNTLEHGGGGTVEIQVVEARGRRGLRLSFRDEGPGMADLEKALTDGYSSSGGLGLGLGGARRLVDEFEIESQPGRGTRVTIVRWM